MRVAAVQLPESWAVADGIGACRELAAKASAEGAALAVFPELSLTGYSIGAEALRARAEPRSGPLLAAVAQIAIEYRIALCVGYPESPEPVDWPLLVHNSVAVISADGILVHHYRKTHLFGEYEWSVFTPGGADDLAVSSVWLAGIEVVLGVLVCMDIEYPEPARLLALKGAKLLLVPTALACGPVATATPTRTVPTRAIENHVHLVYSNFNGNPLPLAGTMCGQSAVIGPDGTDLRRGPGVEAHHRGDVKCSAVLVAECDPLAFVADVHRNPYLTFRRPELYAGIAALPLPPPATSAARLVEFVVGNSAEKVDGLFQWTAYLRPTDPVSFRYLVSSVAFELHPTFVPRTVTRTEAPFAVTNTGWAEFMLQIRVLDVRGQTHHFMHFLSFKDSTEVPNEHRESIAVSFNQAVPAYEGFSAAPAAAPAEGDQLAQNGKHARRSSCPGFELFVKDQGATNFGQDTDRQTLSANMAGLWKELGAEERGQWNSKALADTKRS